jgi:hypothetical protein
MKSEKKNNQKGMSGSPISLSQEEIEQMANQYMPMIAPIMDKIVGERYIKPLAEEINKLKSAYNNLITAIEKMGANPQPAQQESPNPNPTQQQNPMLALQQNPMLALQQNPLLGLLLSKALGGGNPDFSGLAQSEKFLITMANVFEAVDRIRGKSMFDAIMEKAIPRMLIKNFANAGLLTKKEAEELEKVGEK